MHAYWLAGWLTGACMGKKLKGTFVTGEADVFQHMSRQCVEIRIATPAFAAVKVKVHVFVWLHGQLSVVCLSTSLTAYLI